MEGATKEEFTFETAICQSLSIIFTNLQNSTEKQILPPDLLRTCPILQPLAELRSEVISDLRRGAHIWTFERERNTDQRNLLSCILFSGGGEGEQRGMRGAMAKPQVPSKIPT